LPRSWPVDAAHFRQISRQRHRLDSGRSILTRTRLAGATRTSWKRWSHASLTNIKCGGLVLCYELDKRSIAGNDMSRFFPRTRSRSVLPTIKMETLQLTTQNYLIMIGEICTRGARVPAVLAEAAADVGDQATSESPRTKSSMALSSVRRLSMFNEERKQPVFCWSDLGDIEAGRPNLGSMTPVAVYRMMQYSIRAVLMADLGVGVGRETLVKAGKLAGLEFCKNVLNRDLSFDDFLSDLGEKLKALKVGVIRVEKSDPESLTFVLTVSEDLDCSGLPISDETVCDYDEGFLAGIMTAYTGVEFEAREVDCWASGARVCRFVITGKK
jgi:uncharacterized protein